MKRMAQKVLEHHLQKHPDNEERIEIALNDLIDKEGRIEPARGLALNTSYYMDGGFHNRPGHQDRFDHGLSQEEKDVLGKEAVEMGELANMLYHPLYALDKPEHDESENQKTARKALQHLMDVYQEVAAEKAMEELVGPMYELLRDEVFDKEKGLNALLPYVMTEGTEHNPESYKKLLMSHFILPAGHGQLLNHWKQGISDYMTVKEMNNG